LCVSAAPAYDFRGFAVIYALAVELVITSPACAAFRREPEFTAWDAFAAGRASTSCPLMSSA
jgi:hypothetical protein